MSAASQDPSGKQPQRSRGGRSGDVRWVDGQAPQTIDEFLVCLAASGIMTSEEARRAYEELPVSGRPGDPKSLAKYWLNRGQLTVYQAGCLVLGKLKYLAFGEYLILEKLGQGGMGQVLKAQHRRMKRLVALKLISGESLKNPDAVRRFQREVQAAARLIHPNIVTAFDANEHEGMHYYVMEFVDGPDLGAVVRKHGALPVERAVNYVLQAARGLAYAHGKGIVHRDMKPSNLLVDQEGTVKILDMGLARMDLGDEAFELTNDGQVLGTADYMAPEQALDTHAADARADIYSLGCTLYRLLTAEPMYAGETLMKKLLAHREAPLPNLLAKRAHIPEALDTIWRKMVAKRPQERQQTMAEVVAAFEVLDLGRVQEAAPATVAEPADRELSEFLSGISERGSSVSLVRGSMSGAVSMTEKKAVNAVAAEATAKIHSGETDRISTKAVESATQRDVPAKEQRPSKKAASKLPAILAPLCAVLMLGLLAGSLAMILKITTPQQTPKGTGEAVKASPQVAPATKTVERKAVEAKTVKKANAPGKLGKKPAAGTPGSKTATTQVKEEPMAVTAPGDKSNTASVPVKRQPKKKSSN